MNKIKTLVLVRLLLAAPLAPFASAAEPPAVPDAAITPWTKLGGIPGGTIFRVAVDPTNPATMFAGAAGGGIIFKSVSGGTSYSAETVGGIYEAFRAIAVDPKNSNIVFAFSSDDNFNGQHGGVYQTQNGGTTWAKLAQQPVGSNNAPVGLGRGLLIDPTGNIIVISDKRQGIYRSANLGASWTSTLPRSQALTYSLVADPNNPNTLWTGGYDPTNNYEGVVWKSTDFGNSWTKITIPALDQTLSPAPYAIAILPKTGKVVVSWFGCDPNTCAPLGGVVASSDGGKTWVNSSTGLPSDFSPGNAVAVDPQISTTLYLTTNGMSYPNGLYQSLNSGANWKSIGTLIGGGDGFFTAVARPASRYTLNGVFAASDVFATTNQGKTWTREDSGINIGLIASTQDDLLNANGLYASTGDGLFHSVDGGQTWTRISNWKGATVPRGFAVDPVLKTHYVFAATESGFWRSANAGQSWTLLKLPGSPTNIAYVAADPVLAGRIYAADTGHKVYRSDNNGTTWTSATVGGSGDIFTASPASIVLDPKTSGVVYAAVTSGLWASTNAGATWTKTSLVSTSGGIGTISILPGTASTLFAQVPQLDGRGASTYALQKSTDGGKTWTMVTNPFAPEITCINSASCDLPPFSLASAPAVGRLFGYGYNSVYSYQYSAAPNPSTVVQSNDGGATWSVVDQAIQPSIANSAVVSATAKNLYVSDSYGTGSAFSAPYTNLARTAGGTGQALSHVPYSPPIPSTRTER